MTDIIPKPSATEALALVRWLTTVFTDSPGEIQLRFDRLISDIDAGTLRPSYVADVLSSLIRDSLLHVSSRLDEEDFRRFANDVVAEIDKRFGNLLTVAKNTQTYATDLKEVWVACEPMLDLVPAPEGFLDTLLWNLSTKKVCYRFFLSDLRDHSALQALLRRRHISEESFSMLSAVQLSEPYRPPVALYLHERRLTGFRGRYRPRLRETADGEFSLESPLEDEWAEDLMHPAIDRHYGKLKELATQTRSPVE